VHTSGRRASVRTWANARGGFRVVFGEVSIGTCDPLNVDAVGARGDRASLLRRAPACAAR
jgi:hypothetical protein